MTDKQMNDKWQEVLQHARDHATGKGRYREIYWLRDSFNEYLEMSDRTSGYSMGGQPGSQHNREVLAEKICLALGHHIGGQGVITDDQEKHLKESLSEIVNQNRGRQLKM